jgi:hypothetical protein
MGLVRTISDRHLSPGFNALGIIERSIGYLQGGYYTGTIPGSRNTGNPAGDTYPPDGVARGAESAWSAIQAFNCVTQVGRLIYDTGFNRRYFAGISGNTAGYFSIDNTYQYQKFSYFTTTAASSFNSVAPNNSTSVDLNVYSQAWIFSSNSPESYNLAVADYVKINLATDTPTDQGNLGAGPIPTSRQALNNEYAAFLYSGSDVCALNYNTLSVASQGGFFAMEQIACGMSVSNDHGYFVGYSNIRATLSGASMTSYAGASSYIYSFGESHSLNNSNFGFMMAGYPDTTGRYNSAQHALCERMSLTTEAHTVMNDLVIPQSSGQMMQGF